MSTKPPGKHNARLVEQLDQGAKQLEAVALADLPQLPERIFVNVFLPLFAGDAKLLYSVSFETWLTVAKSPYQEVAVIDTTGKELFRVPPLLDRAGVSAASKVDPHQLPLSHVITTATQYAQISPQMGQNFLDDKLSGHSRSMQVPVNMLKHLKVWNEIFVRYGRAPIVDLPGEKKAEEKPPTAPSDDYSFDELL